MRFFLEIHDLFLFQLDASLVRDLEQCGLTKCSVYKSLTIDTSGMNVTGPAAQIAHLQELPTPPRIRAIFSEGGIVPKKVRVPSDEEAAFYWEHVSCTDDDAWQIFKDTLGQNINKKWFAERKPRISASTSRQLGFARKKETLLQYFFGSRVDDEDEDENAKTPVAFDSDSLRYGRETEPEAIKRYSSKYGKVVHESGLVISRYLSWLCGSPDGLVVDGNELVVLEVKCPVSGRDGPIEVDYIKDGKLKKSHPYYSQVQIQLFCCDAKMGHFFIYGKENDLLFEIKRDDNFC